MRFSIALLSSVISLSYYIVLYFHPALSDIGGGVFWGLIAFICLHVALRRVIRIHSQHVGLLFIIASLITLYHWFNDGFVILACLMIIHVIIIITVILTFDFINIESNLQKDDGDSK
ncbi:hypothetical protein EXT65_20990 [Pectobacterium carotovorum subsp. carotovorum]|nr:hypothetical protein [Pectobacterium carotovorum]MCL6336272.1 hypothetical protein [Pectobacterium carotovorum subsp. carotovorum]